MKKDMDDKIFNNNLSPKVSISRRIHVICERYNSSQLAVFDINGAFMKGKSIDRGNRGTWKLTLYYY